MDGGGSLKRGWFCRALSLALALAFLSIGIFAAFAMAAHGSCTQAYCVPCLNLAKLQESVSQFGGLSGAALGFLALLALLQLGGRELLPEQSLSNLVALKTRLNN